MNSWMFQGNPDHFDIDKYLMDKDEITWSVRQKHLIDKIQVGDRVFIWRASGKGKQLSGVVALCEVVDPPVEMSEERDDAKYWRDSNKITTEFRARLSVHQRKLGPKEVVERKWFEGDPILKSLRILKLANETNYALTYDQSQRLMSLVKNTGITWNWDECVAGLWAYNETYQKPVSRLPGSPVSITALTIGRAVTGVYNKVMNFRAVDPRDDRKGLPNKNQLDREVWEHYYDPIRSTLKEKQLREDFSARWIESAVQPPSGRYKDFGEAPNDDPNELNTFSRKVRKGQRAFRKNLLRLYAGKCVVTGCSVEEALNAAHIYDHAESGINSVDNGLLLRSDVHDLLDAGLITINPETLVIHVEEALQHTTYGKYHGRKIADRVDGGRPSKDYLVQLMNGKS